MNDQRPRRDSMSLDEATVSSMWEIAAIVDIVEVLERKGLLPELSGHSATLAAVGVAEEERA
jgi:predicted CoA-binding protein